MFVLLLIRVELLPSKTGSDKTAQTYRYVAASEITAMGPVHRLETPTSQCQHKPVQELVHLLEHKPVPELVRQCQHKPVPELVDDPSKRSVVDQM